MSIWNKILIGLILVALLPFFYMAVKTLKTHQHWREAAQSLEAQLEMQEKIHEVIRRGGTLDLQGLKARERVTVDDLSVIPPDVEVSPGPSGTVNIRGEVLGLNMATVQLEHLLANRGRLWRGCLPQKINPGGSVSVKVDSSEPHGVTTKMSLFVFEEDEIDETKFDPRYRNGNLAEEEYVDPTLADPAGAQPAQPAAPAAENATPKRYLGEFLVAGVNNDEISMVPADQLGPRELQQLQIAIQRGKWTLYEAMPADTHDVFGGLDEKQVTDRLADVPEAIRTEFLKDGEPATQAVMDGWGVVGKPEVDDEGKSVYVRPLRDFTYLFGYYHMARARLNGQIISNTQQKAFVQSAEADSRLHEQFRERQITKLKADETVAVHEEGEVVKLGKIVADGITTLEGVVTQYIERNYAIAHRIGQIQQTAADKINARTRNMAGTNPRGN